MSIYDPPQQTEAETAPGGCDVHETIAAHLPYNLGTAVMHIWRAGTKQGDAALGDINSAMFFLASEQDRIRGAR